jgi:plastocyanin
LRLTHITLDTSISSVKIMSGARCLCPSGHVQHHDEEGGTMKKFVALGALVSGMIVLVFASIATAQSTSDQYSSPDQYSSNQGQSPSSSGQAAPSNDTLTVSIQNHAFDPTPLDVPRRTTVTWVNDDTEAHTVTADDGLFDSGVLQPGESYSVWFDGTGTVTYHCNIHPDMEGSLVVGGASREGTTAPTTSPQETTAPQETTTPQEITTPQETTTAQLPSQQSGTGGY